MNIKLADILGILLLAITIVVMLIAGLVGVDAITVVFASVIIATLIAVFL